MSFCKKCSQIRTNKADNCPFGLPISSACSTAGNSIYRMSNIVDEKDERRQKRLKKINKKIFLNHRDGNKCPFADQIYKNENDAAVCTWDSKQPGFPSVDIEGSPLYPAVFQGMGGLFSYPMSNVTNYYDGTYRNVPFGWFSLQGSDKLNLKKKS